jgi:hypothetical protein
VLPRDPTKGRTIPEIRDELHALASELRISPDLIARVIADKIDALADETKRVYRAPVGRVKAKAVTPEIEEAVRRYHEMHPTTIFREIGFVFGIDGGRVSEIVSGKRAAA